MTEVLFYHLERARLEQVLPELLEKTLERGWRAIVRCGDRAAVDRLDEALWTYRDDAFLPHGADAQASPDQPVWLTDGADAPDGFDLLFLVENASADAGALAGFTRCVTIFDGGDDSAVMTAREFWKAVKAAGHDATYWKQSPQGRWEKQA
ncbi:MAG: DNA polymerase III subunit chi [Parvularculaceae bacterium]|nr:DNA polymerase III subunit chi [Parvularculaceae bacterium]